MDGVTSFEKFLEKETERQKVGKTERQKDRNAKRQKDRKTERQLTRLNFDRGCHIFCIVPSRERSALYFFIFFQKNFFRN